MTDPLSAGEALRTGTQLVSIYAAMQAAVPAAAYDFAAPFRPIPALPSDLDLSRFNQTLAQLAPYLGGLIPLVLADGTPELYRFYCQFVPPKPYFYQAAGAGLFINFFNPNDFALAGWEIDQDLKPATFLQYSYDAATGQFYQFRNKPNQRLLTCPADTFELFAYGVEDQCFCLGAQGGVGAIFDPSSEVSLDLAFNFGNKHKGHSAQFRSTNIKRAAFWSTLVNRLGIANQ